MNRINFAPTSCARGSFTLCDKGTALLSHEKPKKGPQVLGSILKALHGFADKL